MKRTRIVLLVALVLMLIWTVGCGKTELKVLKPHIDFSLEDEAGNPLKLSDQEGKIRFITFLYTSCSTTCVATTHYMTKVQEAMQKEGLWGKDTHFYTVSFDPERDTGEAMLAYAEKWKMDLNHWSLVRGTSEDTIQAAFDFGIGVTPIEDEFIHGDYAVLVDQKGQVRKYYTGSKIDVQEVLKDMKSLR